MSAEEWIVSQERRQALVDSMNLPGGWRFQLNMFCEEITVNKDGVQNSRRPGALSGAFSSFVRLHPLDDEATIIGKAFAVVQFLADHELREFFTVAGRIVFDPHGYELNPPDTSVCRRFYIEGQGAVLGRAVGQARVPDGLHGAKS